MVYIGIPKNYTTSPSSYAGTPSLTINRAATVDLDSSNAFEGPEKLLEVWFGPRADELLGSTEPLGLKSVPVEIWKDMLDLVNCKVLSIVESEDVDAYLLSESSMFVWRHKLILKTCGTTTLLSGLPRILEIAATFAGFPKFDPPSSRGISVAAAPYRVFYSRKNFLFPDRQRNPHRSWRDEVKAMDRLFLNGSAYMIGKMNGEHWYLYLTEPYTTLTPPSSPPPSETETTVLPLPAGVDGNKSGGGGDDDEETDETLEILMTDLDEENAKQFYLDHASAVADTRRQQFEQDQEDDHVDVFSNPSDSDDETPLAPPWTTEGHALGTVVAESCGLSEIYPTSRYPESRIDAYQFSPCGFSANGVIPAPEGEKATHYFTVHVTPEPHCSYASFEANVPYSRKGRETVEIVKHVVDIFKPGRFTMTLFEAKNSRIDDDAASARMLDRSAILRLSKMENIPGYRRVDRIVHDLDGYDLVFRYYERHDWKGGAPRIGETVF